MRTLVLLSSLLMAQSAFARVPDFWRKIVQTGEEAEPEDAAQVNKLSVKGPIKLHLAAVAADIEVVAGGDKQISVRLTEGEGARVSFHEEGGDRVELLFNGGQLLRCGRLCVEVPRASSVEVSSDSGDVVVRGVGGDVRARSISGDVAVSGAAGEVRADTVSGDITLSTLGVGPHVQAASTSGDVHWSGDCGNGCRVESRTLSGDVLFHVGQKSSFAMRFTSHSGELTDDLGLTNAGNHPPREASLRARYGSGEGLMEAQTFSGDLRLARAK